MTAPPHETRELRKLATILLLLVLLPTLFFSAYEITSLSQREELIQDAYRQQLEVVLFSLNQYAWDVAESWTRRASRILASADARRTRETEQAFSEFLSSAGGIQAALVADTALLSAELYRSPSGEGTAMDLSRDGLLSTLRADRSAIGQLVRLRQSGYQKIRDFMVLFPSGAKATLLVFVTDPAEGMRIVGILLDAGTFIRSNLIQKLTEAAGEEFQLAVLREGMAEPFFATGPARREDFQQTRTLWLFSDYTIGVRLKGTTIEELAIERYIRNLVLIGILALVILAGSWFVYRTVRREMELAQLKSDFVSSVSHELRTPLSLIRMFAETLQMGRVREEGERKEYYDTIVDETDRLSRLINNILSFSRMESGKREYDLVETDLNEVVDKVLGKYRPHLEQLGFSVQVQKADQLPRVRADAGAVSEALINLMDNAVKYSDREKFVRISTAASKKKVEVEVEDRGIGIAPVHQKKIFEKFYRVSSGTLHRTRGSGLGLSLVSHIMKAHRGQVSVQSEPGVGSTFRLTFPVLD